MPLKVLENVMSLTPDCRLPVAGLSTALTEMRTVMSAETRPALANSSGRMRARRFIAFLKSRVIRGLLERNQHQHQTAPVFERGHRFANDRTLRLSWTLDLHAVTGRVGSGDEIARFDAALICIHPAVNTT